MNGGNFWYTGKKDGSLTPAVHETQAAAEQWIAARELYDPEGVSRGDYYIDAPGDDREDQADAAIVRERDAADTGERLTVEELTAHSQALADAVLVGGEYGGKFILITGNPVDGFTHEGPFDTHDDGVLYAERTDDGVESWWVVPLHAPTRENEETPA